MPVLMFEDEEGNFLPLLGAEKGDPGPQGPQGPPGKDGAPGGFGPLDDLQDVTAPASTPVGKLLGTTATGKWGPVDPPVTGLTQADADARYVNVTGDAMTGSFGMGGFRIFGLGEPITADHAATKAYVDGRIWSGTQAQYDAIPTKDPTVLYVVV
jgi:hypothetical protein